MSMYSGMCMYSMSGHQPMYERLTFLSRAAEAGGRGASAMCGLRRKMHGIPRGTGEAIHAFIPPSTSSSKAHR
jgi:hypothetical protein